MYENVNFPGSSMARFSARRMDSAAHTLGEESSNELFAGKVVRNVGESSNNRQFWAGFRPGKKGIKIVEPLALGGPKENRTVNFAAQPLMLQFKIGEFLDWINKA